MPGSSSTSFIPKHTPNKGERKNSPRQLFIGTLIVRILFFAVLLSSIGVFFYDRKLAKELATEVSQFKQATETFESEQEKLRAVQNMDLRLAQATNRFQNNISIASLLSALEKSTISTVRITAFDVTRESDNEIVLNASIDTDSFDSVIFQREVLAESDVLRTVEVKDVMVEYNTLGELVVADSADEKLSFSAKIAIDPKTIPAVLVVDSMTNTPIEQPVPEPAADEDASVGIEISEGNEENI